MLKSWSCDISDDSLPTLVEQFTQAFYTKLWVFMSLYMSSLLYRKSYPLYFFSWMPNTSLLFAADVRKSCILPCLGWGQVWSWSRWQTRRGEVCWKGRDFSRWLLGWRAIRWTGWEAWRPVRFLSPFCGFEAVDGLIYRCSKGLEKDVKWKWQDSILSVLWTPKFEVGSIKRPAIRVDNYTMQFFSNIYALRSYGDPVT